MPTAPKILMLAVVLALGGASTASADRWVATWGAGSLPPASSGVSFTGFNSQTVRQVLRPSLGGSRIRLRLTNAFGSAPMRIDKVAISRPAGQGAIDPTTSTQVTFDGSRSVLMPRGGRVLSDPISFAADADSDIAVSFFVLGATGPVTWHRQSRQLTYLSSAGDHVEDADAAAFTRSVESWFLVDAIDVEAPAARGAVVALGDSITDGDGSTIGGNARWPNVLARRILARPPSTWESVVNAGIGANRVLNDSGLGGPNAIARLDRDALTQAGVHDAILLEGINDIGFSTLPNTGGFAPTTNVSADEIIAGYKQVIAQAHLAGVRILGGTILPFQGSFYYYADGEAKRQDVNHWIRSYSTFDGVIDFDAVMRNPANPATLAPAYDSGDHLHPNDAGYAAMGNAVKLGCLSLGDATRMPDSSRANCTNPPEGETVYDTVMSQSAGGAVPATLSLAVGPPASFGAFTPGVDRSYDASTTATVTSTAADATLSVIDASGASPGHLVNGDFALREPVRIRSGTGAFEPVSGSPQALLSYAGPASNHVAELAFTQHISTTEPLRTGLYSRTLTFVLSTTTP